MLPGPIDPENVGLHISGAAGLLTGGRTMEPVVPASTPKAASGYQ
jgi:hypothetical protein